MNVTVSVSVVCLTACLLDRVCVWVVAPRRRMVARREPPPPPLRQGSGPINPKCGSVGLSVCLSVCCIPNGCV